VAVAVLAGIFVRAPPFAQASQQYPLFFDTEGIQGATNRSDASYGTDAPLYGHRQVFGHLVVFDFGRHNHLDVTLGAHGDRTNKVKLDDAPVELRLEHVA
jgi:hypothetical protein